MKPFSLFCISIFLICFLEQNIFAQTTMSGGMGLAILNLKNENSLEKSMRYPNQPFVKSSRGFNQVVLTGRLKIERKLAARFSGSYHFRLFIDKFDTEFIVSNPPPFNQIFDYKGNTQILSTTHSGSINFSPFESIKFGIGAFYQMTQSSYFTLLFSKNGNAYTPSHQAGSLITLNYNIKKWSFELNYIKSLGRTIYLNGTDFIGDIDSIELGILYHFYTFKTSKERKLLRLQKGK